MNIECVPKDRCTGCSLCQDICPRKAIFMHADMDGFEYPKINGDCINCGKCYNLCPAVNQIENDLSEPTMLASYVKDEKLLLESASGGAFSIIAEKFIRDGEGYIYGAAYSKDINTGISVKHICSHNLDDLKRLKGSKYVLSDMKGIYKEIKQRLIAGERVMFTGTPCQVSALKNYCSDISDDKLLLVDLVCHGAPNQRIFNDYLKYEEKRIGSKIRKVKFRYKIKRLGEWYTRNILITTEDDRHVLRRRFCSDFLRAYHPCLMNRLSCYECIFSKSIRYSDITIGDFWGIERIHKELSVEHGVSVVQFNSKKSLFYREEFYSNANTYKIDIEEYKRKINNSLSKEGGIKKPRNRQLFLDSLRLYGFHKAINRVYPFHKDAIRFGIANAVNKVKMFLRR